MPYKSRDEWFVIPSLPALCFRSPAQDKTSKTISSPFRSISYQGLEANDALIAPDEDLRPAVVANPVGPIFFCQPNLELLCAKKAPHGLALQFVRQVW